MKRKPAHDKQRTEKNRTTISKKQTSLDGTFTVEGLSSLRDYLKFSPQTIQSIHLIQGTPSATKNEIDNLLNASRSKQNIPIMTHSDAPQGVTSPIWCRVKIEMIAFHDLEGELKESREKNMTILALDHISDPRNLGAIVRSAAYFGVPYIIVPERRQVLLSQSAVSTAQAGFALTKLVCVVNLSRAIEGLKDLGFWSIGTDLDGESMSHVTGKFERQLIVLGSEDKGISVNVRQKCDVLTRIQGAPSTIDSLNVSVAAGIILQNLVSHPKS